MSLLSNIAEREQENPAWLDELGDWPVVLLAIGGVLLVFIFVTCP